MIAKVSIRTGGGARVIKKSTSAGGVVSYHEKLKLVDVQLKDELAKRQVEEHLSTPRIFRIPESQKIDDFREETVLPTESLMHWELSMCTLFVKTGVWVDWATYKKEK